MPTYNCDADDCDAQATTSLTVFAAAETVFLCVPHLVETAVAMGTALLATEQPTAEAAEAAPESPGEPAETWDYAEPDPRPKRRQRGPQASENGHQAQEAAATTTDD